MVLMRTLEIAINKTDSIYVNSRRKIVIETPEDICIVCKGVNPGGERRQIKSTDTTLIFSIHDSCKENLIK